VDRGITVIASSDEGIDMTAHLVALDSGGQSIVVLAEGLAGFRLGSELSNVWDPARALLLSEFPPTDEWAGPYEQRSNGTMCDLSTALIVIEAPEHARAARCGRSNLARGKPTFAIEWANWTKDNAGNRALLQRHARAILQDRSTQRAGLGEVFETIDGA
jgi:DNA processing protein